MGTAQIARVEGLYRCTGLGETKFAGLGERLPQCSCPSGGTWELRKEDNIRSEDAIPILIGGGIIHMIETDELPEIGYRYNIRQASGNGLKSGLHRVTEIDENFKWGKTPHIWIRVERIGDLAEDLPIHQAGQLTV